MWFEKLRIFILRHRVLFYLNGFDVGFLGIKMGASHVGSHVFSWRAVVVWRAGVALG